MATRMAAIEDDPVLGVQWKRLVIESERLRAQHANLHGRPVDLPEHRMHRRQLERHAREIRQFRDTLLARRSTFEPG